MLQDDEGQIFEAHSISAGLDYPGVGPEHSFFKDSGRAEYVPVTDAEALDSFVWLSRTEGIIPAFETSHAIAELRRRAASLAPGAIVVVNLSGRGDKDAIEARRAARRQAHHMNRIDEGVRQGARGEARGADRVRHRGRSRISRPRRS